MNLMRVIILKCNVGNLGMLGIREISILTISIGISKSIYIYRCYRDK